MGFRPDIERVSIERLRKKLDKYLHKFWKTRERERRGLPVKNSSNYWFEVCQKCRKELGQRISGHDVSVEYGPRSIVD